MPSPANPPVGCRFRTRCWKAQDICASEEPLLRDMGGGQFAACHFPEMPEEGWEDSRTSAARSFPTPRSRGPPSRTSRPVM